MDSISEYYKQNGDNIVGLINFAVNDKEIVTLTVRTWIKCYCGKVVCLTFNKTPDCCKGQTIPKRLIPVDTNVSCVTSDQIPPVAFYVVAGMLSKHLSYIYVIRHLSNRLYNSCIFQKHHTIIDKIEHLSGISSNSHQIVK